MYRLLVIDDEPDIVEGLHMFFRNVDHLELEVFKAYSGFEALEVLSREKVDIVISDILMPGMNGLQLLEKIKKNWPRCRVLFLTGHNQFDYIYAATKYDGVGYLLKTEGFDAILKAVENSIVQIDNSLKTEELFLRAEEQSKSLLPFMQRDYIIDIINSNTIPESMNKHFAELKINLNANEPVLLAFARFDMLKGVNSPQEKSKFLYSVELITEQHFSPLLTWHSVLYDRNSFLWLIQPRSFVEDNTEPVDWKSISHLAKRIAESVQNDAVKSLDSSISFIIDFEPVEWNSIFKRFDLLKLCLFSRIGLEMDLIMLNNVIEKWENVPETLFDSRRIKLLETYLESGNREDFMRILSQISISLSGIKSKHYTPAIELFCKISLVFLSFINRAGLTEKLAFKIGLSKLTHIDDHASWKDAMDYFKQLAEIIFMLQDSQADNNTATSINNVKKYIVEHLNEDLSLVRLADKFYFNPSYLSRLFKQMTGENFLSYINYERIEKAKQLLRESERKIHEIAADVGYDSASYFTQFFKRITNISPQEYRDSFFQR